MQDPDVDRRSRSLLGWIRRLFDKDRGSDRDRYELWVEHYSRSRW